MAVKRIIKQVLLGLSYLHDKCHIIHTDIKPENILVCLSDSAVKRLATESVATKSAVSNIPSHLRHRLSTTSSSGGCSSSKVSKNKKKKLKKKQKQQQQQFRQLASECHTDQITETEGHQGGDNVNMETDDRSDVNMDVEESSVVEQLLECKDQQQGSAAAAASCIDPVADCLSPMWDPVQYPINVKIADLGNACWVDHHFTEDIQTRQYRSPEVLIGAGYGPPADVWSVACMAFELVTGDYLFEPRSGKYYSRDEDHLAHVVELLGHIPKSVALSGKYSREFFNRKGELRHIQDLKFWSLQCVLTEKYDWSEEEAEAFSDCFLPMLDASPSKRATAAEAARHPWFNDGMPNADQTEE